MPNVSVGFIKRNFGVLVSLLCNSEFSVLRLQVHQSVEQNNKNCSSFLQCGIRDVQLVIVHR